MRNKYFFIENIKGQLRPKKNIDMGLIDNLNSFLKKEDIKAICVLGGSTAKGTMIKDDHDIDIFVKFDYCKFKNSDLSDELEKILKRSYINFEKVHGSRDYFQIKQKDLLLELVPVLDIDSYKFAKNVTDMSPLHVRWVQQNTDDIIRDEIRLLKQFCKANNLYGAESYIGGFSGHILDILCIYYRSFLNTLKEAKNWDKKTIIDIKNYHDKEFSRLNKDKLKSPLIIIDPLQPERNAAAALSKDKYEKFKILAKRFLDDPSVEYFKIKSFSINNIIKQKKKDEDLIILDMVPLKGKTDIIGGKLFKIFKKIISMLNKYDFIINYSDWFFDKKNKCYIYFYIKKRKLSDFVTKIGPPSYIKDDVKNFMKKNPGFYKKDDRYYVKVKRKYITPFDLIKDLSKSSYIKNRAKTIKIEVY